MKIKVAIVSGFLMMALLFVGTANAAKPTNDARPGWGYGDKNHVHTGPPGISVRPSNSTTIENNFSISANTGGNVATGGGITTGAVNIVLSISNFVRNIF